MQRQANPQQPKCPPHWFCLEIPHGPMSQGVCKYCGEEREFPNSMADPGPLNHPQPVQSRVNKDAQDAQVSRSRRIHRRKEAP